MQKFKNVLLCRWGMEPREVPQISSTIHSSSCSPDEQAPLSSPKQTAPHVQQSAHKCDLRTSKCVEVTATGALASTDEAAACGHPYQCAGPHQSQQAAELVPMILEATPFSVAVLSSDGKEVLHHCCGSEPGAARFLTQTISQAGSTHSFVSALLGDLAEHALKTVHGDRSCWKGSVSVEFAEEPPSRSRAEPSRCPVDPSPSASAAHHARFEQPAGSTTMGKAHSSPPQLLHNLMKFGDAPLTTSETGPAVQADSALLAELVGSAKSRTGKESLSFETNLGTTDPWRLPSQSWAGPGLSGPGVSGPDAIQLGSFTESKPQESIPSSSSKGYSFADENRTAAAGEGCSQPIFPHKKPPPRSCNSMSATSPPPAVKRQSSLLMTDKSIELHFVGPDETKTKSLLKSLAQQAQVVDGNMAYSPKKGSVYSKAESGCMCTDKAVLNSASPNLEEPLLESMRRNAIHGFDVTLSLLRPADGKRSPLLVVISNSSDHLRARATLSALAESQLELLSGIMPQHAIQFLSLQSTAAVPQHVGHLARAHTGVTLLFMDIVGFTAMSKAVEPNEVMVFLNTLFSMFDQLTNVHKVHKVETAGDCYIVSGGIMSTQQSKDGFQVVADQDLPPATSAEHVMEFAKAILEVAEQVNMPDTHQPVHIRVGLHTGNVVSGMIGSKLPKFSVFGDTMNTASRLESTGVPGRIHASSATRMLLPHERWEPRGSVEMKGKGPMETFLWVPEPAATPSLRLLTPPPFTSGTLPCVLLKQTQSLLEQITAHVSTGAAQYFDESLQLKLDHECGPVK